MQEMLFSDFSRYLSDHSDQTLVYRSEDQPQFSAFDNAPRIELYGKSILSMINPNVLLLRDGDSTLRFSDIQCVKIRHTGHGDKITFQCRHGLNNKTDYNLMFV